MQSKTVVEYRGRKYVLLRIDLTERGEMAMLSFLNKKKTFWVEVDRLDVVRQAMPSAKPHKRPCGSWRA